MKTGKNDKPDNRNWKNKFFNETPKLDANGKPIPWDPPLNSSFFLKRKDTAGLLREQIDSLEKKHNERRNG